MSEETKQYNIHKNIKMAVEEDTPVILEAEKQLSQSMVWKLQNDFFAKQGPEAWTRGIVPQYITTNPYIANLYAKIIFGYLRDYAARTDIDKNSTIYIMELASGVGRFTYTFLKRFLHIIKNSSLKGLKFKYIVTDFSEKNIKYWQNHSSLKPYFDSGILDCATFDITKDEELHLRNSGEILASGSLKNPLILIANYTFDSLPQDTFYVNEGEIFEGLITITSPEVKVYPEDKSILAGLDYYYTDKQIQGDNYYEDDNINKILLYYKNHLEDTSFSLPIMAMRCISRLKRLFNDDIILISSDKGYKNEKAMLENSHPFLSKHGCISMTVNFHCLEQYFKNLGGKAIHSIYDHENINMSLFLLSSGSQDFVETSMVYNEIIESIGPDDFYILKKAAVSHCESLETRQILTFIRFTVWDARTFRECYNILLERIDTEENFPLEELIMVMNKVWDHYFPIGEEGDLAYYIGLLFSYVGYDSDALRFFEYSHELYGASAEIYYRIGVCSYNLNQIEKALEYTERSLALDSYFPDSRNLKMLIQDKLM
ncbi:tetratricopeptide repeat protein [Clostridium bowmanii]|uniref:tetratricopeptide repeat protein n=1 Tax=Clostridium bowmanii TaxID=132925 RepID=UPI001C0E5379|nr:tetratricopeptide repeat protein [Clostridium bowmanii]MBU3191707.1 tetratricopeptide repeat protein [Clostridium bowmanii]MCA1076019.1 tetratricopeptide repeat protein [Clostridium bowmanii]